MQGIIWNYEQKLLDIFRQTAKGKNRLIYLFWEKQWQKAFFDKRPGWILCDAEKGDESAQREIWGFYAHMACTHASRFARGFCRDSGNIAQQYFSHNKKDPCDRVRIGCAFALLIWLCLKQGSLLQRSLRSGSYWVRLCTFDLIVFEARKHRLRGAQAAQGLCEGQIVWIICTSAIPAGTVWTNAVSIFYNDSIALVNYLLKFC